MGTASRKTALFLAETTNYSHAARKSPYFVDRKSKMMVLSTETALFVDRKCFVLKRGVVLSTAAIKTAVSVDRKGIAAAETGQRGQKQENI